MSLATTPVNEECVVLDEVIFKKEKIDPSEVGHLLEFEVPVQTFEYEVTEVEIEGTKTGLSFDGEKCSEPAGRYTKVSQDTERDPYCVVSEVAMLADISANMTESIRVFNRVLSSVTKAKASTKKSTRRAPAVTMDTIATRRDQKIKEITANILSNTYTIKDRCRICKKQAQSVAFQLCKACETEKARQQLVNISVKERMKEYKSKMRALEEKKERNCAKNFYDIRECWVRLERCNATDTVARLHANNCHASKPYHCETCKRKLDSAQCQPCEKKISIRQCSVRLERCDRTKKPLKTQRKTIKCRSCNTEIDFRYNFCKSCERETSSKLLLAVSKQKCVTGTQTNGFWTCYSYCNKCNRKFINAKVLADHKRRKHRVPYSCETCKSVFSTLGCLQQHVRVHTAPG